MAPSAQNVLGNGTFQEITRSSFDMLHAVWDVKRSFQSMRIAKTCPESACRSAHQEFDCVTDQMWFFSTTSPLFGRLASLSQGPWVPGRAWGGTVQIQLAFVVSFSPPCLCLVLVLVLALACVAGCLCCLALFSGSTRLSLGRTPRNCPCLLPAL